MLQSIEIKNGKIYRNNHCIWEAKEEKFALFSKSIYENLGIAYPKFHKMDKLSKLAFLSAEFLLKNEESKNIAIVLANSSSSLDTDMNYQNSINDQSAYYPTPATFVYTLPNICVGEICIRHGLHTENTFFVFPQYDESFIRNYAHQLLRSGKAEKVLCGWVEVLGEKYHSKIFLIQTP